MIEMKERVNLFTVLACFSPLPRFESTPGHVRKMGQDLGLNGGFHGKPKFPQLLTTGQSCINSNVADTLTVNDIPNSEYNRQLRWKNLKYIPGENNRLT